MHTRLLVAVAAEVALLCPPLGSEMIAAAHAHLWSSLRQCSAICEDMEQEAPLLAHPKTMVSCLSAGSDFFPDSLLSSCGTLVPFRLSSYSQPQSSPWGLTSETRASAPSLHPPWWVSRQVSQAGECWSVPILCAGLSSLCPLHPYCCTLLCGSEAPYLADPKSDKLFWLSAGCVQFSAYGIL